MSDRRLRGASACGVAVGAGSSRWLFGAGAFSIADYAARALPRAAAARGAVVLPVGPAPPARDARPRRDRGRSGLAARGPVLRRAPPHRQPLRPHGPRVRHPHHAVAAASCRPTCSARFALAQEGRDFPARRAADAQGASRPTRAAARSPSSSGSSTTCAPAAATSASAGGVLRAGRPPARRAAPGARASPPSPGRTPATCVVAYELWERGAASTRRNRYLREIAEREMARIRAAHRDRPRRSWRVTPAGHPAGPDQPAR